MRRVLPTDNNLAEAVRDKLGARGIRIMPLIHKH